MIDQHVETAKHVGDALSVAGVIAVLVGWLPPIAAFLTAVYTVIRIYETRTVAGWRAKLHDFLNRQG